MVKRINFFRNLLKALAIHWNLVKLNFYLKKMREELFIVVKTELIEETLQSTLIEELWYINKRLWQKKFDNNLILLVFLFIKYLYVF